jgi:hypothetical protein
MGKILTYLKISEDNQSRDVLDAERLLEGMQAIYATSPSGSKKDNFAIPLAEMTKIFIEKVKGISTKEEPEEEPQEEPKQEEDDTFKVGDMFYVVKDGQDKIYQVLKIEGEIFTFTLVNNNNANVEELNFYSTSFMNLSLKRGTIIKISNEKEAPKEQDFPYQVDDRFYLPSLKTYFKISKISGENVSIRYEGGEMLTLSKTSFLENITQKTYISLNQTEFKIGDKYLNKTVKDTFTIVQVYTDFIDVKFSGGNEATYDMLLCKERVADGTWVKILDEEKEEPKNYKVGDKFLWAKEDMTFVIDFIKNGELGIIYSDGLTGIMTIEQFEKGLSTGYYKPYTEEAKQEEKKPRKPRQPRTKSEQDKKIEHILDINLDEIQF